MRRAPSQLYCGTAILLATVSVLATEAIAEPPCFDSTPPDSAASTGAATAAGVSVVAANSSTTQILEMVAERREEQSQSCPAGYVSVGGACQPTETQVAGVPDVEETALEEAPAEQAAQAAAQTGQSGAGQSATQGSAAKPKAAAKVAKSAGADTYYGTIQQAESPTPPTAGAWLEGYAEKETLGDLPLALDDAGSAFAKVSRERRTAGFMTGIDRTILLADQMTAVVGALGGHTAIFDRFTELNGTVALLTPYTITPLDPTDPGAPTVTFDFRVPHDLSLSVQQEQQSDTVGVYGSLVRGDFFIDGLFSVDFRRLRQTTFRQDGYKHSLTGVSIGRDNVNDANGTNFGCITNETRATLGDNFGDYSVDTEKTVQKARFENYVAAMNLGYRADVNKDRGTWWEPSGTITYMHADFGSDGQAMGLDDGDTLRLQGGARFGVTQLAKEGAYLWTVSAGAYAYSDVLVDGYVIDETAISAGSVEAEEGLVRFLGTLRADITWLNGVSWYVEGDTRLGENLEAYGGRLGGRVEW